MSHTREWQREKRSSGKESGEEVLRALSRLAASPLDFAATRRALCLFAGYVSCIDTNFK